jgi:hypothetical protein
MGFSAYNYAQASARLLFYNGMVIDGSNYWPSALNYRNSKGLNYGIYDLYEDRWEDYMNFICNAKIAEFKVMLTATDIAAIDLSRKIRVNGINYLVKEIKTPLNDRAIGASTMTCYKV